MSSTNLFKISSTALPTITERIAAIDWRRVTTDLDAYGCALVNTLLSKQECLALAETYTTDELFRSRVVMARHGFGRGEYKYFSYPLPDVVSELRSALYPQLSCIANRWNETMDIDVRFP